MTDRRFYVSPDKFSETITLAEDESRHLSRVLRLTTGDEVHVFDGNGRECLYLVGEIRRGLVTLAFSSDSEPPKPESPLRLTLAVPILKRSNTELVLQKAVELGVSAFVPLITKRSEIAASKWKSDRAFRIACEAAKQCGRAVIPAISEPTDFERFISEYQGRGILFYELDGGELPESMETDQITAVTGPEGGWEEIEIQMAKQAGFEIINLGGRILRAETAPIVAATLLQHHFGDLN